MSYLLNYRTEDVIQCTWRRHSMLMSEVMGTETETGNVKFEVLFWLPSTQLVQHAKF